MSKGFKLSLTALIFNLIGLVLIVVYLATSFGKVLLFLFIFCMLVTFALSLAALVAINRRN